MISRDHSNLSVVKQSGLLQLHRSGFYYKPKGESELNLELMRLMDEHYADHYFKGAKRMHTWLTMDKGYKVNQKRIDRLYYKVMGLRAIMPGKHTSKRNKAHKVYPYLLHNLKVERPNQVWATDITYIPMRKGFMYLVAIIDLHSRYVLNWSVSNTMDAQWCKETLEEAIAVHGKPEIVNTDQGSQFTSEVFTRLVLSNDIKLSMDGKGRAIDNVFIERLWRSVKYESVYLNPPDTGIDLYQQLKTYFDFYNNKRRHQGIDNQIPFKRYLREQQKAA
ncbi:IS3 family transposase [Flavobacterium sp. ASW18X]|uniref:IS3 family transposase n=1 Tax=Flavobacterium sp. ASW18X TaxID=2572595 RepID=UPI0010AE27C4|nr:IS3 family transposase [Flavobacterium sp. ASW18X]TKD54392.1 IS3 family transposase [Flavobacterium sp. ASW18X]